MAETSREMLSNPADCPMRHRAWGTGPRSVVICCGQEGLGPTKQLPGPPLGNPVLLRACWPLRPRPQPVLCLSSSPWPTWAAFCKRHSVCLSLPFADRLHTLSEKSCHLEVFFAAFFSFFSKKLMFSCQPGRQTACIILSHAKGPFKAAIICSGCVILRGQWEGP